ncbi:MAG: hypothetical protein ONB46_07795 [candidate division KSB1 bacterium]|nr:hypothetical protein [candidate division KSB1 bacterium]MDZ7365490.1 hypothetical protein [candidate division KSB1 bacterium]MDZ7403593.1 hypothetical protein [candidate division KSB1 bacterium]
MREDLEEYLRFRHLFRGSYGFDLEPERMRPLFDQLESVLGEFEREVGIFLQTLSELAKGMESDSHSKE